MLIGMKVRHRKDDCNKEWVGHIVSKPERVLDRAGRVEYEFLVLRDNGEIVVRNNHQMTVIESKLK